MTRISVLGTGAMGSRIAANLAAAGHDVVVWNRSRPAADALAGDGPIEVADSVPVAIAGAEIVISMVTDDRAAHDVWLDEESGALASMPDGAVAIESSTITPGAARELGATAAGAGVEFLEAPVVGSRPQAEAGALLYLVGGSVSTLERVRPIVDVNAGAIRPTGEVGTASVMKLAINGLFGVQVAAYAETVGLLARSGVPTGDACELLAGLPITSPGLQRILGLFADGAFSPNFPIDLVAKDFGYLQGLSEDLAADMPVAAAAGSVYASARDEGLAELDIAGVARRYG